VNVCGHGEEGVTVKVSAAVKDMNIIPIPMGGVLFVFVFPFVYRLSISINEPLACMKFVKYEAYTQ
jgi:hypothetical protein